MIRSKDGDFFSSIDELREKEAVDRSVHIITRFFLAICAFIEKETFVSKCLLLLTIVVGYAMWFVTCAQKKILEDIMGNGTVLDGEVLNGYIYAHVQNT